MGTVLGFKNDLPMMKATSELEYDSVKDIITMDKEEVMKLLYTVKVTKGNKVVEVTKDVPISQRKNPCMCCGDVIMKYEKDFDIVVDTIDANMARTTNKKDHDKASTVTVKQVDDFQRGHRRDLTVLKHFN
eukprot:2034626-Ditylum_brightwellii.AAC.1